MEKSITIQSRGTWWFNDPFGTVKGDLTESADFYLVENTSDAYAFLKLKADDPNMIALLYFINNDGTLGSSTGFGVYANQPHEVAKLPTGTYAIVIGSTDGSARGSYDLHWNRSNPAAQPGESSIVLNASSDLSKTDIYYSNSKILSNGKNIMTDLTYEERRDFIVSNGYAHITTSIYNVYETGDMYIGNFSFTGNTSYSTNNALIVEITRAGYSYLDRYYQNIVGNVTSWISRFRIKNTSRVR